MSHYPLEEPPPGHVNHQVFGKTLSSRRCSRPFSRFTKQALTFLLQPPVFLRAFKRAVLMETDQIPRTTAAAALPFLSTDC